MLFQLIVNIILLFIFPGLLIVYGLNVGRTLIERIVLVLAVSIAITSITGTILGYLKYYSIFNLYLSVLVMTTLIIFTTRYLNQRYFKEINEKKRTVFD